MSQPVMQTTETLKHTFRLNSWIYSMNEVALRQVIDYRLRVGLNLKRNLSLVWTNETLKCLKDKYLILYEKSSDVITRLFLFIYADFCLLSLKGR